MTDIEPGDTVRVVTPRQVPHLGVDLKAGAEYTVLKTLVGYPVRLSLKLEGVPAIWNAEDFAKVNT